MSMERKALGGAVAVFLVSAAAQAGMIEGPGLEVSLAVGGQTVLDFTADPDGQKGSTFSYGGLASADDWMLDWDAIADPDPFVNAGIVLTNNSGMTQTFTFTVILPIAPAVTPASLIGGTIQGGVTGDAGGGTVSSVGSDPIYRAIVDGGFVGAPAEMFSGRSVTVGAFQSGSFNPTEAFGNMPIPSAAGPAANTSIGIELRFTLTPGDQASFTSSFVLEIPSPGALALMGLAATALFGPRPRRR
ncbi:MAG: hypothetical protein VYC34_10420 [Planctomycetota bacterium]|nr:hypothetical protein [Planctomycetota bacterium]